MGTRLRQQACCSTNIGPSVETEPNRHHVHAQQKKSLRLKFELRPRVRLQGWDVQLLHTLHTVVLYSLIARAKVVCISCLFDFP